MGDLGGDSFELPSYRGYIILFFRCDGLMKEKVYI